MLEVTTKRQLSCKQQYVVQMHWDFWKKVNNNVVAEVVDFTGV